MWVVDDPARLARALRSSHKATSRVEVWAGGELVEKYAPFQDGTVTDTWVVAGVRRTLSLSIAPSVDWLKWLAQPRLELRPFRGVQYSRSASVECPLGRFPVLPPERSLPLTSLSISADDYYQRISDAKFSHPVQTVEKLARYAILDLFYNSGAVLPGLQSPVFTTNSSGVTAAALLERTRHDAIADYAKSFSLEVFVDRIGQPTIADAQVLGSPVSSLSGTVERVATKPDDSKVFNQVAVTSSAQGVDFEAQVAVASDDSPAAQWLIGPKVLTYASPVITTPEAAMAAAKSILAKVSGQALTYTYSCVPDPSRDAGDTVSGPDSSGATVITQVSTVSHPLTSSGRQQITTVSTQAPI